MFLGVLGLVVVVVLGIVVSVLLSSSVVVLCLVVVVVLGIFVVVVLSSFVAVGIVTSSQWQVGGASETVFTSQLVSRSSGNPDMETSIPYRKQWCA